MSNYAPRKNLLFVTGTRADYGKLEPLALAAQSAGHSVIFFVTGMHMMEKYGLTKKEVHWESRFTVFEFINQREGDPQDIILAKTVSGFSDLLQEERPDLVVIHGDRVEALACALVCATNYVQCAHIEGGEVSGTIDEQFRHCNTKLSTYHLVSSEEARERVIRLGEAPSMVHVVGSPELDIHGRPSGVTLQEVKERYEIESDDFGICIFHPVTSEQKTIGDQARALFDALVESKKYFVVILPNNDPGSEQILDVIHSLPVDRFRILPSMRFSYFSELMRNSAAIVGNSSMGVREAPFLGVPSLDIGSRQSNRAIASSLSHASPFDKDAISRFLEKHWARRFPKSTNFGAGDSAHRFLTFLDSIESTNKPFQKLFVE